MGRSVLAGQRVVFWHAGGTPGLFERDGRSRWTTTQPGGWIESMIGRVRCEWGAITTIREYRAYHDEDGASRR